LFLDSPQGVIHKTRLLPVPWRVWKNKFWLGGKFKNKAATTGIPESTSREAKGQCRRMVQHCGLCGKESYSGWQGQGDHKAPPLLACRRHGAGVVHGWLRRRGGKVPITNNGTPPGAYSITVNATSGASHTAALSVTGYALIFALQSCRPLQLNVFHLSAEGKPYFF
jgi:hypothetical protein